MKNIYILLTALLIASVSFANDITISFANNKYDVVVDGRLINNYNSNYNNSYTINNLSTGRHRVEIYKTKDKKRNGDYSGRDSYKERPVYSSNLRVRQGYDLFLYVDKKGRVQVEERVDNEGYNRQDGYGNQRGNDRNHHRQGAHDRDDNYDRRGGYQGNDNGYGGYNNNNYNRAMSDADFNQLLQTIRGKWFGKLSSAKDAVQSNYFTTYQVGQLLQIFSSESDRLELAKLAYRNTVDQQNYRQLYSQFSYQSQNELDQYIRSYRY